MMKKNKNVLLKKNKFRLFYLLNNSISFTSFIVFSLQILQAKIRRLEHLLHLKDIRVDDLAEKLDQTRGVPGNSGARSNRQQQTHVPINGRK